MEVIPSRTGIADDGVGGDQGTACGEDEEEAGEQRV